MKDEYRHQITLGKIKSEQIESILQKPRQEMFGVELYDTVFKKAACLLEGIIRTHPFPDGNKRTALLAMTSFLYLNGHRMAVPVDAVKFLTGIAMYSSTAPEDIDNVTKDISEWIETRSSTNVEDYDKKLYEYFTKPIMDAHESEGDAGLEAKLDDWFQIKMHPEYSQNTGDILKFIESLNKTTRDSGDYIA